MIPKPNGLSRELKIMKMRSEHSWSLLDPKPVIVYVPRVDEYLVYWNGYAMTHSIALCVAMEHLNIYPTPEMKFQMVKAYERVYYAGVFCPSDKIAAIDGSFYTYYYYKKVLAAHLKSAFENQEPKQILKWFDLDRARINHETFESQTV
jgi:hypothetical protein